VALLWLRYRLFASTDYQKCALVGKKQGFLVEREKKIKAMVTQVSWLINWPDTGCAYLGLHQKAAWCRGVTLDKEAFHERSDQG
jgi:hypothetical protein